MTADMSLATDIPTCRFHTLAKTRHPGLLIAIDTDFTFASCGSQHPLALSPYFSLLHWVSNSPTAPRICSEQTTVPRLSTPLRATTNTAGAHAHYNALTGLTMPIERKRYFVSESWSLIHN